MKEEAKKDESLKTDFIRAAVLACAPTIWSDANGHPYVARATVANLALDLAEELWAEYEKRYVNIPPAEVATAAEVPAESTATKSWGAAEESLPSEVGTTRKSAQRRT